VNGAKSRRAKNVVEKKKRKKNKSSTMSCFFNSCKYIPGGNNLLRFVSIVGEEMRNTRENSSANMIVSNTSTNMLVNFSSTVPSLMQSYTSLLLGLDQNA
jgi:hypothetical protein